MGTMETEGNKPDDLRSWEIVNLRPTLRDRVQSHESTEMQGSRPIRVSRRAVGKEPDSGTWLMGYCGDVGDRYEILGVRSVELESGPSMINYSIQSI